MLGTLGGVSRGDCWDPFPHSTLHTSDFLNFRGRVGVGIGDPEFVLDSGSHGSSSKSLAHLTKGAQLQP